MNLSRRNFLGNSTAFGLLSAFMADPRVADALGNAWEPASTPSFGQEYWSSLYASDSDSTRGPFRHMSPEERVPAVYYSDPNAKKAAILHSYDVEDSQLPDFTDEAVVTLELTGFRPGSADHDALDQVNFANMHLSCRRISGSEFIGPIAWATIASVFSNKTKKLPAVSALDWSTLSGESAENAGGGADKASTVNGNPRIQHLLLSHGAGKLSVNITTTPKKSPLDRILTVCLNTSRVVTPMFGFPAISTLALSAFYDFYGKIEAAGKDNFLLATARQDVVVAKRGLDVPDIDVHPLRLLSGDYILVPLIHQKEFESKLSSLAVVNGFVVDKNSTGALADRVKSAIPDVTYLALSAKVQSASTVPSTIGITDSILDDQPAGGSTPKKKTRK